MATVLSNGNYEKNTWKLSSDVYAVSTNFGNEGENNKGIYSLIIGCPVSSLDNILEGFVYTVIPESIYNIFKSETGKPDKIGGTWQKIWEMSEEDIDFDQKRTYLSEFEQYQSSGEISIYIGIRDE